MTKDGGRRTATPGGAMLADGSSHGEFLHARDEALFDPQFWAARGALGAVEAGRGAAWFIDSDAGRWVLRHYRRGGTVARLRADLYLWMGERQVRAFAEWRLLHELSRRGLPVPRPVAARYLRSGPFYRCDLITERLGEARPVSGWLAAAPLDASAWRAVGATIARLHAAGVDHVDLNAHNLLLDAAGRVSVIDFDRGRLRPPGPWAARNLRRLRRSLAKIAATLPTDRFADEDWRALLAGYAGSGLHAPSL